MARSRPTGNSLKHLLASAPVPVYALDDQRVIVYCNDACTAWLELSPEELLGAVCNYQSATTAVGRVAEIASGLCPPPQVFAGERLSGNVGIPKLDGQWSRRHAEFVPLGNGVGQSAGVLVFLVSTDLTVEEIAELASASAPATASLHARLRQLQVESGRRFPIPSLVGESATVMRVRDQVSLAMDSHPRTLIVGPPGSGREHIARTIHAAGAPETAGPLLPLACSLLDASLLQTTMEAFVRQQARAPESTGGSLLLLDIDQLPTDAQNVLARFCASPSYSLRTLATARSSLFSLADTGRFRRDLAAALGTLVIELPPLAERRQDLPLLVQAFVEELNGAGGRQLSGFAPDALQLLAAYAWPGNVDELAECVAAACHRAAGPNVTAADLPPQMLHAAEAALRSPPPDPTIMLDDFLADVERELIRRALRRARGNKTQAARLLGINRARLLRRISQLRIDSSS